MGSLVVEDGSGRRSSCKQRNGKQRDCKHGDGKYLSCKRVNGRQHGMQGVGTLVYCM